MLFVGRTCHPRWVELTGADFDAIPRRNLHVPRVEFARLWLAAEQYIDEHPKDWYGAGVAVTCRWLGNATVRPATGRWYKQYAPVTLRQGAAYEEVIEAECVAAEKVLMLRPVPSWVASQPGWFEAILATLDWAWRHGPVPLAVHQPAG